MLVTMLVAISIYGCNCRADRPYIFLAPPNIM